MNFNGKRITIMGLGSLGGGVGAATFLAEQGARLLITDLRSGNDLKESLQKTAKYSNITYVFGEHREQDFLEADMVVKNPAVRFDSPYLAKARNAGIPIETDISIFLKMSPAPVIGVTGTKGKSTTSALVHAFLNTSYPTFLGSVAGVSPFDFYNKLTSSHLVVLELSSFELQDLAPHQISPHGAVVTNVFPDHLNYHKNFEEYLEAKKGIFKFQKSEDFAVFNFGNDYSRSFADEAPARVRFFNNGEDAKAPLRNLFQESNLRGESSVAEAMKGEHNKENVLAALCVARLYGVPLKRIRDVLSEWKGIPYRQQLVAKVGEVLFYNDTTATIPQATIAALRTIPSPLILLAGGLDKELDYRLLGEEIRTRDVSLVVLFPGSASVKINEALVAAGYSGERIKEAQSMEEAIRIAFHQAKPGYSIVLSPAATSFNLFKNEFDRGEQFNNAVKALLKNVKMED